MGKGAAWRRSLGPVLAVVLCLGTGPAVQARSAVQDRAAVKQSGYVYVAGSLPGRLTRLDTDVWPPAVADAKSLDGSPAGVAVTPDGRSVYVANNRGTVSVIDADTYRVDETISTGGFPVDVAIPLNGKHAYVADADNGFTTINTSTHRVIDTIPVQGRPTSVAVTDDGTRAYVTSARRLEPHPATGFVSIIDITVKPPVVLTTLRAGSMPYGVALTVDGSRAYVADPVTDSVFVIDAATRAVTQTISVPDGPSDAAVTVDGTQVYVTDGRADTVSVLDTTTNQVIHTIKVGSVPHAVVLSDDGTHAYVAGATFVSVIDTAGPTVVESVDVDNPVGLAIGTAGHRTAISLGDSFISGVAGRWRGNAAMGNVDGDDWGTDRAAFNCDLTYAHCDHDAARVYGSTAGGGKGCLRTESSEIHELQAYGLGRRINLACSGAETPNLKPGGEWWKGEAPQADQLRRFAYHDKVELVVVSIGGNDMGFRDIISSCVKRFLFHAPFVDHCNKAKQSALEQGLRDTEPKIREVVGQVARVMADAGYNGDDYRLVLQSYPNPVAPGAKNRYPESNMSRYGDGGCPVFNDDSDWVKNTVVPGIADMLQRVARDVKIDFLDVRDLFSGHEVCSKDAKQSTSDERGVSGTSGEWARFLDFREAQGGYVDESVHPNYYGQEALGACLSKVLAADQDDKDHTCSNRANQSPEDVHLSSSER